MWKCLNCTHLKHSPYQCWDNGPDHPMDENLESLSCEKEKFYLNSLEMEEIRNIMEISDNCYDLKWKEKE